jgi:large subunit ribosomal protein L4
MALQAPLFDATGKSQGNVDLSTNIFEAGGSRYVLHEVIVALQRNQRRGTSMTKTRGLVSGGGRKPWKQKGTGNARAGSIRSPLWRKGGIIFGPLPRSHRINIDGVKKESAMLTALSEKAKANEIVVLESLKAEEGKTSSAVQIVYGAGHSPRTLLVVAERQPDVLRATRNINWLETATARELNAWMLMRARKVIFLRTALEALEKRFPKGQG